MNLNAPAIGDILGIRSFLGVERFYEDMESLNEAILWIIYQLEEMTPNTERLSMNIEDWRKKRDEESKGEEYTEAVMSAMDKND